MLPVFVAKPLFDHFHKRWSQIDREWLGSGIDSLDVLSSALVGVRSARAALRAEVRVIAPSLPGPYLIPV